MDGEGSVDAWESALADWGAVTTGLTVFQRGLRAFRRAVAGLVLLAVLLPAGVAFRVWQVARVDDLSPADSIMVLGAAQYNGVPSPVYEARLERALRLYRAGVAPVVFTVGGKQEGDLHTEAEAGRRFLVDNGVPELSVIAIEEGEDTLRSVEAVSRAMTARGLRSSVIVSDPTHSLRARRMARDAGIDAWTAPVRHGPAVRTRSTQFHGIVRETGALIWYELTRSSVDFSNVAGE